MSRDKVLFVDDEENILNSLRRGLIDEDYECLFASNGKDALEIIENEVISVLVTDMRMPKMDGLTLLKEVKKISPETIKIVLSGYTQLQQILATVNQGDIFKFIAKPWKLDEEFKVIINQALEYYNLRLEKEIIKNSLESRNAAYQNMIKKVEDKFEKEKKEKNIRVESSKLIIEHLLNLVEVFKSEGNNNFNDDFEKLFYGNYNNNLNSEMEEVQAEHLFDSFKTFVSNYSSESDINEEFNFQEGCTLKTNKNLFEHFMKYLILAFMEPGDSCNINSKGYIQYNINKEFVHFILDIAIINKASNEVTNNNLRDMRIEFVASFINNYLKVFNGHFKVGRNEDRLVIKMELLKN